MTKPPRLVLDTNVVISAMLWKGRPDQLLAHAENGTVRLYTSRALLNELSDTLRRPKFSKNIERSGRSAEQLLLIFRRLAQLTRPVVLDRAYSRDPDDDHVIACAIAARADAIISGDDDLLSMKAVSGIAIRSVAEALEWLNAMGANTKL